MKKGFTIIELLMTLLIVGLLAAGITIGINNSQMKSRDSRRVSDLQLLKKATSMYFLDHSVYPLHNDSIQTVASVIVNNSTWGSVFVTNQYLNTAPYDPENTKADIFVDANGENYNSPAYYAYVVGANSYKYITRLEQNVALVGDDGGTVSVGSNYDSVNVYEVGDGAGWQGLTP